MVLERYRDHRIYSSLRHKLIFCSNQDAVCAGYKHIRFLPAVLLIRRGYTLLVRGEIIYQDAQ
jgi:hypothetical protein